MTLREFEKWAIEQKSVANPKPDYSHKGQCVSLVQQYLYQVHNIPFKARGHAKSWANNIIQGWQKLDKNTTLKAGDIIVYNGIYGHIAIIDADLKQLEQNHNFNKKVTVGNIRKGYMCVLRSKSGVNIGNLEQKEEYTPSNYITLEDMNLRNGAGINYTIRKVSQMSTNGKKHATSTNPNANATYKKGTEFTAQEIVAKGNEVWAQSPSGYICIKGASGKVYCKKK